MNLSVKFYRFEKIQGLKIFFLRFFAVGALAAAGLFVTADYARAFDFSDWAAWWKKYVSPVTIDGVRLNGMSYTKLKSDPAFPELLGRLKKARLNDLKEPREQLAFWINVYNILAVKMILDHHPVKSIKDIGSIFKTVWERPAGEVAGTMRTLHEVEHEILRKMGEPRIHAAIVCASVSCPDLPRDAFFPDRLEHQLEVQMKGFLQNRGKGLRVDRKAGKVYLSSIFDWFEEDFKAGGGVLRYLGGYVSDKDKQILKDAGTCISYLDYNWKLNEL